VPAFVHCVRRVNGHARRKEVDRMSIHDDSTALAGDGMGGTRATALCVPSCGSQGQGIDMNACGRAGTRGGES
jgi:hypothetical protein